MTDPATGQRSFVQALKVPFDLKGVAAGALAYLALLLGGRAILSSGGAWGDVTGAIDRVGGLFSGAPVLSTGISRDDFLPLAALNLAVAAIFGVACCRIAGMRIARDEGLDLGDSLAFSVKNIGATLGAVLFMVAAAAFFYACNALAGLLSGIPGVGPLLMIVLYPLVLLSTLVLFLLLFGTVLGLPLTFASLAVERNGALDAVSRAFSYVFSRPVLFFAYGITIYFVASLLAACALTMEGLARWTFAHWMPEGDSWRALQRAVDAAWTGVVALRTPQLGAVGGLAVLGGWVAWVFGMVFHLSLFGWVLYYAYGGFTGAYFALRRDVDGTEDEEIWVEGEEDRFGEPEKPSAPPPSPAAGAPAPAQGGGPPPAP